MQNEYKEYQVVVERKPNTGMNLRGLLQVGASVIDRYDDRIFSEDGTPIQNKIKVTVVSERKLVLTLSTKYQADALGRAKAMIRQLEDSPGYYFYTLIGAEEEEAKELESKLMADTTKG